jgi:hypothetical protein
MDQDAVEARIERLFKEAKPRSRIKKGYIKLTAALILAAIPLSITQQPGSQLIPVIPAITEAQDLTITPSVLADTDKTLTITVDQPGTVFFFYGCAHARTRTKNINAFANPDRTSDI